MSAEYVIQVRLDEEDPSEVLDALIEQSGDEEASVGYAGDLLVKTVAEINEIEQAARDLAIADAAAALEASSLLGPATTVLVATWLRKQD